MGQLVDNLIAFRIVRMLVTPFAETDAFKYGIIDAEGNPIKKLKDLRTMAEKDSYTMLHRMVFRMKRMLAKLPGGESKLASFTAAYFLVKECYEMNRNPHSLEEDFEYLLSKIENNNIVLIEETLLVERMLKKAYEEAPTNVTGEKVSTNEPVVRVKKQKKLPSMSSSISHSSNRVMARPVGV
jgi:hypothetical protein